MKAIILAFALLLSSHDAVVPISVTKATGFVSLRCIKD